jgi:hypothetical protein
MKMSRFFSVALLLVTQATFAAEKLPQDVREFIDRREGCDHMRGEFPETGDEERINEVNEGILRYCKGTDAQLKFLKKKYAKNRIVMSRLVKFESEIEEK